ncbi:hypothetical protein GW17_00017053 [Ensete ventricosum]|nr:hypothetical protein GW17_00017053 [Ensete ventricosum]
MAPASKSDRKAPLDAAAWMFNILTSVGVIMVNKALMATHQFSFGAVTVDWIFLIVVVLYETLIAKLSMIPVSCLLEVVFDKIRYSRATKLSIVVVLVGVAVCTVTDVSVNSRGLIAATIAVWSTSLQQYVSK